jgi:PIN domain nuclease of toxin-antitoxin system
MIVLDTHIWVWWVHDDQQLSKEYKEYIELLSTTTTRISCNHTCQSHRTS